MIAWEGDPITCENGHIICRAARDIADASKVGMRDFREWRLGMPYLMDIWVDCCLRCKTPFAKIDEDGVHRLRVRNIWK